MKTTRTIASMLLALLAGCSARGPGKPGADAPLGNVSTVEPVAPAPVADPRTAPTTRVDAAVVRVRNSLPEARSSETIAIDTKQLVRFHLDPSKTVVIDAQGNGVTRQLVDLNGDAEPDELVFQSDFAAGETQTFALRVAEAPLPATRDFKVYGRFVRERHDDFAWENDRVAGRAYGPALETFVREPLTSSGFDVWSKRVPDRVINDWYMTGDYHRDTGQGGDFYSVGTTRGCGGLGLFEGEKLSVSKNFSSSAVLANGPVRLVFELSYAAWGTGANRVSEVKRVTLDGGKNFLRIESRFTPAAAALPVAVGIAKHAGATLHHDAANGVLHVWEPFKSAENGEVGCAVILPKPDGASYRLVGNDHLLLSRTTKGEPFTYYAGSGWSKSGQFADAAAWAKQVASVVRAIRAPLEVGLEAASDAKPWGARLCDSEMQRHPRVLTAEWDYATGVVLKGCQQIGLKTKNAAYLEYVKATIDGIVAPDGTIEGYALEQYDIDDINMGKVIFGLLAAAQKPEDKARYTKALGTLRSQMKTHPRTREGGFWHKRIYPHQMWLDGIYMASPFLAEYAVVFNEPALFDDVTHQIVLIERKTRDAKTGLLHHGWDESREQRWADEKSGKSPAFWGRGMGWYAMAVVDTLEFLPKNHPKRPQVLAVLERLAAAVAKVQDRDKAVWWQVLDAPKRDKNFLEASASSMFVYAIQKAVNRGWLPREPYEAVAGRGFRGILREFVQVDPSGALNLTKVCKVAGLGVGPSGGPHRDGTFEYYTSDLSPAVTNDPKGVGAFILASAEREP